MTLFSILSSPRRPDLRAVAEAFASESGSIGAVLFTSDGTELRVGAAYPPAPDIESEIHIALGQGVSGQVARNGSAMLVSDDRPRTTAYRQLLGIEDGGGVARLCLPARGIDGDILGVVSLHRHVGRPYDEADLVAFQPYADLLGIRLQARHLLDAVDTHHNERERLIAAAVSAQEAERRRIASDLHDGVTTALASMSFQLNAAELSIGKAEADPCEEARWALGTARSQIEVARTLGDLAYNQTRAAITGLHSLVLDDLGLAAAIESLAETTPGVSVDVQCDPATEFTDVPEHAAASLYRIAQETLSNAVRHAQATRIALSLRRKGSTVVLTAVDDGVGFDVRASERRPAEGDDRPHFGLASMAERCTLVGATLSIDSRPGRGTTVSVELPV